MILISQGVTWSATVATGFTFLGAPTLSATASAAFGDAIRVTTHNP